jgi:hypothetical protein
MDARIKRIKPALMTLFLFSAKAAAELPLEFQRAILDIQNTLVGVGSPLATLMIVIEGLRWTGAQSPQERESAKKGIIYIMFGVMLLKQSETIVVFLLS